VSNPPAVIAQIDEPPLAMTGSPGLPESTSPPVEEFANATSPTSESAGRDAVRSKGKRDEKKNQNAGPAVASPHNFAPPHHYRREQE
jgi:hypothetical protein